ncbi:MAG: PepSY-like domain-containing protein [Bacteroidales bacterium]|jgi:hypothetical protein|nr:PepSY-like domain-containing protein [Bacteroidales bacterium]
MNIYKKEFAVILAAWTLILMTACSQETIIPQEALPLEITTYISTHFPDYSILQSVKDRDDFVLTYDIILSDGISLEFNRKNEIIDIDGHSKLPDSVIPEKILLYVKTNYPSSIITDWELDDRNQQVQLDNGLDIEFTMSGDFVRIDD